MALLRSGFASALASVLVISVLALVPAVLRLPMQLLVDLRLCSHLAGVVA